MNRKKIFAVCLVCFVFSFLIVQAAAAGGIKERMKQRLPRIVEMKKQGIIGENANGYLEYVTDRQTKPLWKMKIRTGKRSILL